MVKGEERCYNTALRTVIHQLSRKLPSAGCSVSCIQQAHIGPIEPKDQTDPEVYHRPCTPAFPHRQQPAPTFLRLSSFSAPLVRENKFVQALSAPVMCPAGVPAQHQQHLALQCPGCCSVLSGLPAPSRVGSHAYQFKSFFIIIMEEGTLLTELKTEYRRPCSRSPMTQPIPHEAALMSGVHDHRRHHLAGGHPEVTRDAQSATPSSPPHTATATHVLPSRSASAPPITLTQYPEGLWVWGGRGAS